MPDLKQQTIDEIIRIEGGYVNDSADSGGETNFGITVAVARACGYTGDMQDLPRAMAFDIYSHRYWDAIHADEILSLSEQVAVEMVDTSVNAGPGRATIFLQRTLNVFNNRGQLYPDIIVDAHLGPATIQTLRHYLAERDEQTLVKALNCLQGAFYIGLAENREKDEKFIYGWFKNRVTL